MESINILIVEDDVNISNMLVDLLTHSGYTADTAYSGTEALFCLEKKKLCFNPSGFNAPGNERRGSAEKPAPDLGHPGHRRVRKGRFSHQDQPAQKSAQMTILPSPLTTKSFWPVSRLFCAVIQEIQAFQAKALTYKGLTLNPSTYEVYLKGQPLSLTKREYKISGASDAKPTACFLPKIVIYETVWEDLFLGEDNAINVHISNLRQKLAKIDPDEAYIQTVWGIGFKMK